MPIKLVRDDITKVKADAIVNSTNRHLEVRGTGLSGSIHAAAGPELDEELAELGRCELGEAVITSSYRIKTCKYIMIICSLSKHLMIINIWYMKYMKQDRIVPILFCLW